MYLGKANNTYKTKKQTITMHQQINAKEVKEKILEFLEQKGPSLPVQVAKHVELNSIFASAFLSELAAEGVVKISDMKVGGSPLYFLPEKKNMLENFLSYLSPKEREACVLLKEQGLLDDANQTPVIRVALRSLRDFAIPLKKDNRIFWKYFSAKNDSAILEAPQSRFEGPKAQVEDFKQKKPEQIEIRKPEIKVEAQKTETKINYQKNELKDIQKELDEKKSELERIRAELIETRESKETKIETEAKKIKLSKKEIIKAKKAKAEEVFLNEIKDLLERKDIRLLRVEQFDKKQVLAQVKIAGKEHLLAAFDKKKIEDGDLIRVYKKAAALNMPYYIFSKGEPSKKTKEAIEAYKMLTRIERIEQITDTLKQ